MASPKSFSLKELLKQSSNGVPSYIGHGVLPKRGRMLVGGQPAIGKSMFVLNMAYALAAGTPVFNFRYRKHGQEQDPVLPVWNPVRVLYLDQEIGPDSMRERLRSIHHSLKESKAENNFIIRSRDTNLMLDDRESRSYWQELLQEVQPEVVVFDPFANFHTSEENDQGRMGRVLHTIDEMIGEYDFAAIVIHHFGKPGGVDSGRFGIHRFRGSSRITGWADTRLTLDASRKVGEQGRLSLSWTLRQGRPLMDMSVQVNPDTLTVDPLFVGTRHEASV